MKEQVDLEVQETNVDLTGYKTLVYNGVTYPDYMINFDGTSVYNLKNCRFAKIWLHGGYKVFWTRINNKRRCFTLEKARVCTFYDEMLKNIDMTNAKVLVYGGIKYDRYLIFLENEPRILNLNTLKFLSTSKMKKNSKNSTQYRQVHLHIDGKSKTVPLHVVIMWTFNGPPPPDMIDPTVDHIDGNGLNNNPANLQWLSLSNNIRKNRLGEMHPSAKADNANVKAFCEDLHMYDSAYTVQELGEKNSLSINQSKNIYYRESWKEISNEFPPFPNRPIYKKQQKSKTKTLF